MFYIISIFITQPSKTNFLFVIPGMGNSLEFPIWPNKISHFILYWYSCWIDKISFYAYHFWIIILLFHLIYDNFTALNFGDIFIKNTNLFKLIKGIHHLLVRGLCEGTGRSIPIYSIWDLLTETGNNPNSVVLNMGK